MAIELSDRLEIEKQNRIPPEMKAEGGGVPKSDPKPDGPEGQTLVSTQSELGQETVTKNFQLTKGRWGEVPADAWKIIFLNCPVPKMKYILYFKISTQEEQIFGRPKNWGLRSNTCLTCGLKQQFWQRPEKNTWWLHHGQPVVIYFCSEECEK